MYANRSDLVPENVEAICLEINKTRTKSLLISTWYRPPSANIELFNLFEHFFLSKEIIIAGDFNYDTYMLKEMPTIATLNVSRIC